MALYSIYIHIPFCKHRCGYCDFNTYAGQDALIPAYVNALTQEAIFIAESFGQKLPVHTIFFGGGTPSLLTTSELSTILQTIDAYYHLEPNIEISLEANPGTVTPESLKGMRDCGINRLSLGVQSSHSMELNLLERQHDFMDVVKTVSWARKSGFENINLDLIYGLPYQTLESWLVTLDRALNLKPEHLSLYALTLEHGTPMKNWVDRGMLEDPDGDLVADMYEATMDILMDLGYTQYEISNWAIGYAGGSMLACRHNLQYWRVLPYIGLGAGAHGNAHNMRVANVLSPAQYIRKVTGQSLPTVFPVSPATQETQIIDQKMEMAEVMMMGMRLVQEGVDKNKFSQRFGLDLVEFYGAQIDRLRGMELVEWAGEQKSTLRLTKRGRLLGNIVFREFL